MTTVITRGAASAQALGYAARATAANYIEDVFSTYLYTGNWAGTGNTNTVTVNNGIDLTGKGGLLWIKQRANTGSIGHALFDTARGANMLLSSDGTGAQYDYSGAANAFRESMAFSSDGFSVTKTSVAAGNGYTNYSGGATYASWTFRKQAKFFDVVTYTGDGSTGYRMINHSLGSVPGFIIIKPTSTTGDWVTLARQAAGTYVYGMYLNQTVAGTGGWDPVANGWLTSTQFTTYIGNTTAETNTNGVTYVAYLFAHNAGGFGASGSDNVISCGSYTGNGSASGPTITLGYEPQWLLVKDITTSGQDWVIQDVMRGMTVTAGEGVYLRANSSAADAANSYFTPLATGFQVNQSSGQANASGRVYIYIAIRRGPMRTPTSGTSVFTPIAKTGDGSTATVTNIGFPADLFMFKWRSLAYGWKQQDRLRGFPQQLSSNATSAESNSGTYTFGTVNNTGYTYGSDASINPDELNYSGVTSSVLAFARAPGFFDEVCYTGTGSATTFSHNLGAVPELMITKCRGDSFGWAVYASGVGNTGALWLESTAAVDTNSAYWNNTTPTSSVFTVGNANRTNRSGIAIVAYLFATVAGVSKVGSYTGTGTTLQVNCGFTGGARFVLIKRTDSTGDWYVWDSARGIVAGNDPYLLLNSTAAEVTNTDYVDTYSAGFEISSTAPAAINANGGTFIFLAIA